MAIRDSRSDLKKYGDMGTTRTHGLQVNPIPPWIPADLITPV